jgi:hypothetical protein
MVWPPPPPPPPVPKKPPYGALTDAVQTGDTSTVQRLLAQGADVNERDQAGNSVLSRAAYAGYMEIARLLVDKGANLDSRNSMGETALMFAVSSYSPNRDYMVRLLLDKGANIDIRNTSGNTAQTLAVMRSRPQLAEMIKETVRTRQLLAEEFARAAEAKRRDERLTRQERLIALGKSRPKPKPVPKPPEAA